MRLAGTGHRPDKLGGYTNPSFIVLVNIAKDFLSKLDKAHIECVISGLAQGWDQAWALAALDLKIPLISMIPFEGQEKKWSPKSQAFYRSLLNKSTEVRIASLHPSKQAFQIRNEMMVDACTTLVAMFDGTQGGTFNCIKYAEDKSVYTVNLYDQWVRTIDQNLPSS